MIVMPANSTGWFWHCLARETGRIGHLYSPGAQRGPWPWFPFALDNGAFACWDMQANRFDDAKWEANEPAWRNLIRWAAPSGLARWAIVPDVPGDAARTFERWEQYHQIVTDAEINTALAVQDGMTVEQVKALAIKPSVICVGGSTEWKWETVEQWAKAFPRVHVLRCNSPEKLYWLESIGVESCDGTGWNRGDRKQTEGLEAWARQKPNPRPYTLTPYVCRKVKNGQEMLFGY
jgi:hypothetical protein